MRNALFSEVPQKKRIVMEKLDELQKKVDEKNISTDLRFVSYRVYRRTVKTDFILC